MNEQERGQDSFKTVLSQLALVMMGLVAVVLVLMIAGGVSDKYYTNQQSTKSLELDKQDAFAQGLTYEEYLRKRAEEEGLTRNEEMPPAQEEAATGEQTAAATDGLDGLQPLTAPGQVILEGPTPVVTQEEMDILRTKAAVIHTTMGDMPAEFNVDLAPMSVKNFFYLAEKGYFDGQSFYRMYPGAFIVTGSPTGRKGGTPGYWLNKEFTDLVPVAGALAYLPCLNEEKMASEFAIFMADGLGFGEDVTVFGRLTTRINVAEKCADSPATQEGYTADRVYITKVEIIDRADLPNQ